MLFISGASFPSQMLPALLRTIAKAFPMTHVVNLMKAVFAGNPFGVWWVSLAAAAGFMLLFGSVGAILYRRKNGHNINRKVVPL